MVNTKDQDKKKCDESLCNKKGTCYFLPFTKKDACNCTKGHFGNTCEDSKAEDDMSSEYSKIMGITSRLPTTVDLKYQIQKQQASLMTSFNNLHAGIAKLDSQLNKLFDDVNKAMQHTLKYQNLLTQYGEILRNIRYYYQVFISSFDPAIRKTLTIDSAAAMPNPLLKRESLLLAKTLLNPDTLRKHLYIFNYLVIGREDLSLVNHKSLLFLEMDRTKKDICTEKYKSFLDRVYQQIITVQMQGYIAWIHALSLLELDSKEITKRYHARTKSQTKFFDENTCQLVIANSKHLKKCKKENKDKKEGEKEDPGYYIYTGMKVEVECEDNAYLTGEQLSSKISVSTLSLIS